MDSERIGRLRYVRVSDPRTIDLRLFPDFLIIGPQRTGTTWLHANLREHPEVLLSEPKELFFFSRLKPLGTHKPREISPELADYLRAFRERPLRYFYKQGFNLLYNKRFYRPRVRGEATATYAAMDRDVIADIKTLRPELKAVMMLRDPVERAWSHAKKDLVRNAGRPIEEVGDKEFEAFFRDPYQLRCAQYEHNLANWRAVLGEDQVFAGSFEDIQTHPVDLMCRVMRFLGVDDDPRFAGRSVHKAVNPAGGSGVPERYRTMLEEILLEQIDAWKRLTSNRNRKR